MLCASTVLTFAVSFFLAVYSSVNMPTAVISVLVRTFVSVLIQTLAAASLPVLVQATVPAFPHTVDSFITLMRAFSLPIGNPTMLLDPSFITPPMVPYNNASNEYYM